MDERPSGCPLCGGAVLVRSGHACGRQRWRCKGCGRQFTRTEPRGKPAALKRHAIELYCLGLSMNAVAKRVGVSAQSMLRWVRIMPGSTAPSPSRPGARPSWSSTRSGTSSKKILQALDLEGVRARHRPADRLGMRRPRPGHVAASAQAPGALGRPAVLHRRLGALRHSAARRPALYRQGPDTAQREQQCPTTALVRPLPTPYLRGLALGRDGRRHHGAVRLLPLQRRRIQLSVSRVKLSRDLPAAVLYRGLARGGAGAADVPLPHAVRRAREGGADRLQGRALRLGIGRHRPGRRRPSASLRPTVRWWTS